MTPTLIPLAFQFFEESAPAYEEPAYQVLENLPLPDDQRIVVREVPARTVAVLRYSGRWTERNYRANRDRLLQALRRDSEELAGEPVFAVYNGPFTPWFLRRNEVMVDLRRGSKQ